MKLTTDQECKIKNVLDAALTDAFYTILFGLNGSASIGGLQQEYKITDENGVDIKSDKGGGLASYASDFF